MIILRCLLIAILCYTPTVFAQDPPALTVGIDSFSPPFIMQGEHKEVYGFDIDMMNSLCTIMQRRCVYKIMRFDQLFPALINKELDVAVSNITITAERLQSINFSTPYALSNSRFLTQRTPNLPIFNLTLLTAKNIGVVAHSVFEDQIKEMGIKNATIKTYSRLNDLIEALHTRQVDYVLIDNPSAHYWAANSQLLTITGPLFSYGNGLGIAMQPGNNNLLTAINNALFSYEKSPEYKQNYERYLNYF